MPLFGPISSNFVEKSTTCRKLVASMRPWIYSGRKPHLRAAGELQIDFETVESVASGTSAAGARRERRVLRQGDATQQVRHVGAGRGLEGVAVGNGVPDDEDVLLRR